jgi:acyl transferase domain-containing protein
MDGILGEFRLVAERLAYAAPTIPIISGLTGRIADDELCAPEYWVRQIRHTVRFYDGIKALAELGATKFVELGPDATLAMMAHDCLDEVQHCDATPLITSPLRRDRPEADTVRRAIAELHVHGQDVDWRAAFTAPPRRIRLPTYPFERHRYWLKPPLARVRDDPDGAIGPVEPQPCTGRPARGRAGG